MLFALRREPDDSFLKTLNDDAELPVWARAIFALELRSRKEPADAIRRAMSEEKSARESVYFDYYRAQQLILLGYAQDAIALLKQPSLRLGPRDRTALRFQAYAALGWHSLVHGEMETLLQSSFNSATLETLCVQLIRTPDPESLALLCDEFSRRTLPAGENRAALLPAVLCAAGASGDFARMRKIFDSLREETGGGYRSLELVARFFSDPSGELRVEQIVPILQPMPVEISYALFERYYRSRAKPAVASTP